MIFFFSFVLWWNKEDSLFHQLRTLLDWFVVSMDKYETKILRIYSTYIKHVWCFDEILFLPRTITLHTFRPLLIKGCVSNWLSLVMVFTRFSKWFSLYALWYIFEVENTLHKIFNSMTENQVCINHIQFLTREKIRGSMELLSFYRLLYTQHKFILQQEILFWYIM